MRTVSRPDTIRGIIEIYTITSGIYLGERLFTHVSRQVFILRLVPSNPSSPRPTPHDQIQPLFGDRHTPAMPTSPLSPRVNRTASTGDGSDTQSNTPNQDYQARVAPVIARLRAQGVEFNETPRRFNFPADLTRAPRAASSSPARGNTSPVTRQTSLQRTDTRQSSGFVSDGYTVWSIPAPEPDHDSETDHEGDPGL